MKAVRYLVAFALISGISISIVHALARPQQTRTMFIDWYDFKKDGRLYYRADVDAETIDSLKRIIRQAEGRVEQFWGTYTAYPKIIYCHSADDYRKFGNLAMTPAVSIMNVDAHVVVQPDGFNVDVLAHELTHTELFNRIGLINRERKIPVWFDEGLAMQVDWRAHYSLDSLKKRSAGLSKLPNVTKMISNAQFGSGSNSEIQLNYLTSKYEVGEWLKYRNLDDFIDRINDGDSFDRAFGGFID